jgi:hypothetical protein
MPAELKGIIWLVAALLPLLFLQGGLHREIQSIFLLLTRRADLSIMMFSVLFFPGVLLHESSHYVMARLLGVRTGGFSLLPQPLPNGRLRLGYVLTDSADWVRESLIGVAPLVTGGLFVAYAGYYQLGLPQAWQSFINGTPDALRQVIHDLATQPDFWLWFYLTLVVSSTMLPSESDRRAWLPLGLVVAVLLAASLFLGAGPWLEAHLAGPLNLFLVDIAMVFAISALIHLLLLLPLWVIRRGLERVLGLKVI